MFHKHSILLGAAILYNGLFAAFFVSFSGGVREESFSKDGMISEIIDEGPCPVRVFHPFNLGAHVVAGGEASAAFFVSFFSCLGVMSGNLKLVGNLESEVGTQSCWGPSCGCDVNLGPNLRKEAQLKTSNFAKLGSKLESKLDHKLCYCETP